MPGRDFLKLYAPLGALSLDKRAAGGKTAAGPRIYGTGNLTFNRTLNLAVFQVRHRDSFQQGLSIRVSRVGKELDGRCFFNALAQVHNDDFVADMFNHRKVVLQASL